MLATSFGASAVVGAFGLTINTLRRLAGLGSLSSRPFDFGGRVVPWIKMGTDTLDYTIEGFTQERLMDNFMVL
jgi:hypothetical protein